MSFRSTIASKKSKNPFNSKNYLAHCFTSTIKKSFSKSNESTMTNKKKWVPITSILQTCSLDEFEAKFQSELGTEKKSEAKQMSNERRSCKKKHYRKEKVQKRGIQVCHKKEMQSLRRSHSRQIDRLNRKWDKIWKKIGKKEKQIAGQFQKQRRKLVHSLDEKILAQCRLAQPKHQINSLLQIYNKEAYLIKSSGHSIAKLKQIQGLSPEKKQILETIVKKQRKMIEEIVEKENRKVSEALTRRKQYLVSKIRQLREDKKMQYGREKQYLQKKFKNIERNLLHEQTMQMNQIKMKLFH